jgi:hypothetical protein
MSEIFVKIDGVTGTATGAHQGWLKMQSAQFSPPRKSIGVSRLQDHASPRLFRMAMDGTAISTLTMDFVKDGRIVLRLELTNVLIDELYPYAGAPPMESMTFYYTGADIVQGVMPAGNAAMAGAGFGGYDLRSRGRY